VTFTWDDAAVALMAKAGFDPVYGARPLRRAIRAKLEDALSEKLLDGSVAAGNTVTASAENDEVVFSVS
jgi:ATP-dependent Clp protease ATP-binding subunit ClpA